MAACFWLRAFGYVLLATCSWRRALGHVLWATCSWLRALGRGHAILAQRARRGGLRSMAPCWRLPLAASCWGSTGCRRRCPRWSTPRRVSKPSLRRRWSRHRYHQRRLRQKRASAYRSFRRVSSHQQDRMRRFLPGPRHRTRHQRRSERLSQGSVATLRLAPRPIIRSRLRIVRINRTTDHAGSARNKKPSIRHASTLIHKFQSPAVVRNRLGDHRVLLRHAIVTIGHTMQFLVYVIVLMVSVSTVLLEVHWLTSPPPQPKPAVQTANANAARPQTEGPNAELSPVYPKPEAPQSVTPASNAQQSVTRRANPSTDGSDRTTAQPAPAQQPAATSATPSQQPAVEATAKAEPMQKPNETTGAATRTEDTKPGPSVAATIAAPHHVDNQSPPQPSAATSNNRCDVQACASAYKSFRVSDCSYQPFDGSRRFCEKPPVQRTARDQRDEPERRPSSTDPQPRNVERAVRSRVDTDDEIDDDASGDDDDSDQLIVIRRPGPRW